MYVCLFMATWNPEYTMPCTNHFWCAHPHCLVYSTSETLRNIRTTWYLSVEAVDSVDSCLSAGGGTTVENRLTADAFSCSNAARISPEFSYFNAWTSCRRYCNSSCRHRSTDYCYQINFSPCQFLVFGIRKVTWQTVMGSVTSKHSKDHKQLTMNAYLSTYHMLWLPIVAFFKAIHA